MRVCGSLIITQEKGQNKRVRVRCKSGDEKVLEDKGGMGMGNIDMWKDRFDFTCTIGTCTEK